MKRITVLPLLFTAALLTNCASVNRQTFVVEEVEGNLLIRDIGSDSQMPHGGGQTFTLSGEIPISGVPVPLEAGALGSSLFRGKSVLIGKVGGSIIIERLLTGTQNVELAPVILELYKNGDPFGDTETTIEYESEVDEDG